ncbi:glycosyltransferase family A protein [Pseudomonas sp. PSE14]|uniref:glycosyltransferase family A protein n=1 Tax=Pseudomonas sp. PSE14 TaxID=3016341 RepID=UPI0023D8275A|nr:glycosyltransferase family A protein [Pseudomonas sp. PSE14]WEJ70756.1 glycosyltransferase family A protein [Pseudomonas sp. PSE14]
MLDALRSLCSQTLQDFEVIVVDDGSTERRTLHLLALLKRMTSICLLRQPNAGPGAARNLGIRHARGRYICCLDSDDCLADSYLEKCAVVLESDLGVRLVHGWIEFFGCERGVRHTFDLHPGLLRFVNHLGVSAVFHRDDWIRVAGFSESRELLYEDWDFWMRMASLGIRGKVLMEPMLLYRKHGESRLERANRNARQIKGMLRRIHPRLFHDAAWRRGLVANYRSRPTGNPFCNLSLPSQYRLHPKGVLALYIGGDSRVEDIDPEVLVARLDARSLHVLSESDRKLPAWIDAIADVVYRLPELMDRSQFAQFYENYLRTRPVVDRWILPNLRKLTLDPVQGKSIGGAQ